MIESNFHCFRVTRVGDAAPQGRLDTLSCDDLPKGELLVQVRYSSINYKDALSATGHPGISPNLPHVPGIDAVGVIVESSVDTFPVGSDVLVSGQEFGSTQWGAWTKYCRVPATWAIRQPEGISPLEAATLGTAGFTAAQCVAALQERHITPDQGPIIVSGASGGVGCFSIAILSKLGFEVTAVTGKPDRADWLRDLGAADVVSRVALLDESGKPMLSRKWAAGIDTVGGKPLTTMLRQLKYGGCVAACGLAASPQLEMTVYPFILRGISLLGIDSAWISPETRANIWRRLATDYRIDHLDRIATVIPFDQISEQVERMLSGETAGRLVIDVANTGNAADLKG